MCFTIYNITKNPHWTTRSESCRKSKHTILLEKSRGFNCYFWISFTYSTKSSYKIHLVVSEWLWVSVCSPDSKGCLNKCICGCVQYYVHYKCIYALYTNTYVFCLHTHSSQQKVRALANLQSRKTTDSNLFQTSNKNRKL